MRKTRFFIIIAAVLALIMAGCDNGSTPDDKKPNTSNGTLYSGKAVGSRYLYLSIYSYTPQTKAIVPKDNDFYAATEVTFNSAGVAASNPISMGTITVSGNNLTFNPGTGYDAKLNGTGTLSGSVLKLTKVPGTSSYSNIELEIDRPTITASPDNPFGNNGDFSVPGSNPSNPTNPTNPTDPTDPQGTAEFKPGRILQSFRIITGPEWKDSPTLITTKNGTKTDSRTLYYEGDPITLSGTGIQVQLNWSDGKSETVNDSWVAKNFVIDPPDIRLASYTYTTRPWYDDNVGGDGNRATYTLYYKWGYTNNAITSKVTIKKPTMTGNNSIPTYPIADASLAQEFHGPRNDAIWVIKQIDYNTPAAANSADKTPALADWYEDDSDFNRGDVKVKVQWDATGTYERKDNAQIKTLSANNKATLGTTSTSVTALYGSHSIDFKVSYVRKVEKIEIGTAPNLSTQQLIFDDHRLFGAVPNKLYWLDRLYDINGYSKATIKITYAGGGTKTRDIVNAFNNQAKKFSNESFIDPPVISTDANSAIRFTYFGQNYGYEVPVYNTLKSIEVTSRPGTDNPPIMKKTDTYTETETDFFKNKVLVTAYYESGKNGPQIKRTDTWIQMNDPNTGNRSVSADAKLYSDVMDYVTEATERYANKKEYTKIRVYFNTGDVEKYKDISIGALGYK